jgi:PncC family amidohydrolase
MQDLLPLAQRVAALLKAQAETVAVAESSTGGLIAAALVAVPEASAYFVGGGVIYTAAASARPARYSTRSVARHPRVDRSLCAIRRANDRARLATHWAIAETGATGPTGNPYGDAAGHGCIAISGPSERVITLETGRNDRVDNMRAFAAAALNLLIDCLEAAAPR